MGLLIIGMIDFLEAELITLLDKSMQSEEYSDNYMYVSSIYFLILLVAPENTDCVI